MSLGMDRLLKGLIAAAYGMCALFSALSAYADDSSPGVMLPGLRSEPPGSVTATSGALLLREGRVEVTLIVTAPHAGGSSLTIQMPRFGWLGESETYPDRQFPELQILNDGSPAKVESTFAAFVGQTNVTEEIRKAGMDPFAIADTPPFVTAKTGGPQALEALEKLGAVEKSGTDYIAKWTAYRKVKIALTPGSNTLKLSYKARAGFGLRRFEQIGRPANLAPFCLTAQELTAALGHAPATRAFDVSDYSVPVSIDGKPPASFSVALGAPAKAGSAALMVAYCDADGKAVIGKGGTTKTPARADAKGIAHILSIAAAPK